MPAKSRTAAKKSLTPKRPFDRDTIARGPAGGKLTNTRARMPHERDEQAGKPPAEPDEDMKQAHEDVQSGQVDTDLRGTASRNLERGPVRARKPQPS